MLKNSGPLPLSPMPSQFFDFLNSSKFPTVRGRKMIGFGRDLRSMLHHGLDDALHALPELPVFVFNDIVGAAVRLGAGDFDGNAGRLYPIDAEVVSGVFWENWVSDCAVADHRNNGGKKEQERIKQGSRTPVRVCARNVRLLFLCVGAGAMERSESNMIRVRPQRCFSAIRKNSRAPTASSLSHLCATRSLVAGAPGRGWKFPQLCVYGN
ncbi:hypothetical protein R3P38DRAFT_3352938 [Favolaschia claudopus]|uniref:Uncharacterized protein n=1 Tax=Favolaschia claudopus TaxID=2862362 RepID=A0AAW0BYD3_9AGAR